MIRWREMEDPTGRSLELKQQEAFPAGRREKAF